MYTTYMQTTSTKVPSSPFTPAQSFGPKRIEQKASSGLVNKVISVLFFIALITGGGLFGYTFVLQQELTAIQSALSDEKLKTSQDDYESVQSYDRVVRAAQYLLVKRSLHSKLFAELEAATKQSIFYDSFESVLSESGDISLTLDGVSPKIAQVVLEQDALKDGAILGSARLNRIEKRVDENAIDSVGFVLQISVPQRELLWLKDDAVTSAIPSAVTTDSPDIIIINNVIEQ